MTELAVAWMNGSEQPGRAVDTVRDVDGDIWERWMSDDDAYPDVWTVPDDPHAPITWAELLKEFGPLTDATPATTEESRHA